MTPMRLPTLLLASSALVLLAGCSHLRPSYDSGDFQPARIAGEAPLPKQIVTVPEPLPLPGQLKQLPGEGEDDDPEPADPTARVKAANQAATIAPTRDGYVNAVQIYPYSPGALYQLYAAPGQITAIALEEGESLSSVAAGDTVRWVVGDTASGQGPTRRVHVLVKPVTSRLTTNLVINTDRRAYHLELKSTRDTYMASVSWTYPLDDLLQIVTDNDQAIIASAQIADRGLSIDQLQFRYEIEGDKVPWRPVRAFDDGAKVYIQFPASLRQSEAPPLFVVGAGGDSQLVNYRLRGSYYVVDRLFAAAELRLGDQPQKVVRITRTDA
ncbi:MAG: P-type conjugative transfer protein TrbG [Alphaproteobacteria bacterium]